MNKNIFKKEICSYCRFKESCCSKDKIEYIDKFKENNLKVLKCIEYKRNKAYD